MTSLGSSPGKHGKWREAFEEAAADAYPGGAMVGNMCFSPRALGRNPSPFENVPAEEAAPAAEQLLPEVPGAAPQDPGLTWATYGRELASIAVLAVPLSLSNLMSLLISLIAVGFVGRLGAFELSVVVSSTSVFNVTGLSVLTGFASAMETLTGQAYGARQYRLVGVVLQRALILTSLLTALLALLWTGSARLLVLLGQDPLISRSARYYLLASIGALWGQGVFENLKRYLLAQGVAAPVTAATVLGLVVAPLFNWLFIYGLDLRLLGAALAMDAVMLTMVAALGAYIILRDRRLRGQPQATWGGWSRDALRGWGEYLRYGLPSVFMICCEWWTFEAVILMSGVLPDPSTALSTMGIAVDTSGAQFMLISGIGMALSSRVGNALGAGRPRAASRSALAAISLTAATECSLALLVALTRARWAEIFTNVPEVVARTADLLLLVVATFPGDGTNCTFQGLLRGSGHQEVGAVTNIASYWGVGIPTAFALGIKRGLGLRGLWWGLVIVNTLQGLVMTVIAWRLDMRKAAQRVAEKFASRHSTDSLRAALLAEEAAAGGGPDAPAN